ncbi:hypothetical protein, partial [Gramella sp. AN32]|uniref:hypothetical protein n=1 Tax=Gramella sp. AN32 TaxID=2183748 RepID=UPI002042E8E3
ISYQLSVISYQLSVISYQLSVISYQLSVISYQLSVISYQLSENKNLKNTLQRFLNTFQLKTFNSEFGILNLESSTSL